MWQYVPFEVTGGKIKEAEITPQGAKTKHYKSFLPLLTSEQIPT